jgi:GNAT superfamily N-acetyltransferase
MKISELFEDNLSKNDEVYYHVTPESNIPDILKNGLDPTYSNSDHNGVYLYKSLNDVEDAIGDSEYGYLSDKFSEDTLAVLKITLPDNFGEIKQHPSAPWEYISYKLIPPQYISLYKMNESIINEDIVHEDGLMYELSVTDYYKGETFGFIVLYDEVAQKKIGYLDWSKFHDDVWVKMIEIYPEYRRKGYGTKIINFLKKSFPDKTITYSGTTSDGDKFLKGIGEITNQDTE